MAPKIAERLVWAVETLAVDPADHLLEIGCGHGVAVSLVCEKLTGGKITVTDRSQIMIERARRTNDKNISSGKAAFELVPLDEADFGGEQFNKIFAVHIGVFLKEPSTELSVIERALTPCNQARKQTKHARRILTRERRFDISEHGGSHAEPPAPVLTPPARGGKGAQPREARSPVP